MIRAKKRIDTQEGLMHVCDEILRLSCRLTSPLICRDPLLSCVVSTLRLVSCRVDLDGRRRPRLVSSLCNANTCHGVIMGWCVLRCSPLFRYSSTYAN
jgi:hypothetical protein